MLYIFKPVDHHCSYLVYYMDSFRYECTVLRSLNVLLYSMCLCSYFAVLTAYGGLEDVRNKQLCGANCHFL